MLVFLVSSMLATGLSLTLNAVLAPLRNLRVVLIALVLNFVFAPAFAWLLTVLIPLEQGYVTGLLLLGGAAGAPFLPKVVETAHADLALAVALMGLLTLGTIAFLPLALPLMIRGMHADAWSIARPLVLLIVLPFAGGMLLKSAAAALAARALPVFTKIGNVSLVAFFALIIVLNGPSLLGTIGSGAILVALLYFAGLFAMGWLLSGDRPEVRGTMGLVLTARNFGAALVPAAASFGDPAVTTMIIVGAIVCVFVSFVAAAWVRRHSEPVVT